MIMRFATATAACAILLIAGTAKAAISTYTSQSAYLAGVQTGTTGTTADQVNWAQFDAQLGQPSENGNIPSNKNLPTSGNEGVTTKSTDGSAFTTYVEGGPNWKGSFSHGTTVLYTSDGTITMKFDTPLVGLGLDAQIEDTGTYIETLTAYNTLNQVLATVNNSAVSPGTGPTGIGGSGTGAPGNEGTVPFVGISTGAQNTTNSLNSVGISYITISVSNDNGDGFAIDTSLIYHYAITNTGTGPATTPEPGTLGLLGVGLVGLGFMRHRHKAKFPG